jgi:hypothetical protein
MSDPSQASTGPESFAALGERLHQALLDAYHSRVGTSTLFAFVPGGTPVPDTLVQDGVVNPLQVTMWLGTVAEAPLAVDVEAAAATASYSSLQRAASIFDELVRFALPTGEADSPAGKRFLIMRDEAAANDSGQLPLACEPSDWPLPDAPYWTTFDSKDEQSTSSTTTTSTDPEAPIRRLWQLHKMPDLGDIALTERSRVASERPELLQPRAATIDSSLAPRLSTETAAPTARLALADAISASASSRLTATLETEPVAPHLESLPVANVLPFERGLFVLGQSGDSTTTDTSTTDQTVTLSLSHTVVTVDRSAWWNDNLVRDPTWYIPGLGEGAWVAAPAPDGSIVVGLPVALLLVKSLTVTGTFSDQDITELRAGDAALGPFSLRQATSSTVDGTTTIAMDGTQLIGMFCAPLPMLPPQDGTTPPTDTTTPASSTDPATSGSANGT